jgi:hypothetical protein
LRNVKRHGDDKIAAAVYFHRHFPIAFAVKDYKDTMNKTDYNRFEISYLTDNIKFADQKAGVLIGLDGLLLRAAVDFFNTAGIKFETLLTSATSIGRISVILGSISLILGIILALAVVFPRRGSVASKGLVFWESIAQYRSPGDYVQAVMTTSDEDFDKTMAEQQYFVSLTATKKYHMLRRAFFASSIGAAFVTITAFTLK